MKKDYKKRISINPKIHFGKPCVAGTRIPVENVLELILENIPFEKIIEKYHPDLEIVDIKACIQYAIDIIHSEEIHVEAS
jgi:uncharacterized protein (DUF433 family)